MSGPAPEKRVEARPVLRRLAEARATSVHMAHRLVCILRAQVALRGCRLGARVAVAGALRVEAEGEVEVGDRSTFSGGMLPSSLRCHPGAVLHIGAESHFNYGVSLEAHRSVRIGARCMFASFVRICDRDGARVAPIVIEDEVWVAHGAQVLPGVRIGAGSVVSAGSVVTQDVPPGMLAMGNPARCLPLDLVAREAPRT